jgi:hypothetical protein
MQFVDVAGQRERDHVGFKAVDDGTRLLAAAAVRLLDRHVLVVFFFPVLGEGGVEFHVQFARGIVADVQERDVVGGLGGREAQQAHGAEECEDEGLAVHGLPFPYSFF